MSVTQGSRAGLFGTLHISSRTRILSLAAHREMTAPASRSILVIQHTSIYVHQCPAPCVIQHHSVGPCVRLGVVKVVQPRRLISPNASLRLAPPRPILLQIMSRPYAQAIAGEPISMRFDSTSAEFTLAMAPDLTISAPTEVRHCPVSQCPCLPEVIRSTLPCPAAPYPVPTAPPRPSLTCLAPFCAAPTLT